MSESPSLTIKKYLNKIELTMKIRAFNIMFYGNDFNFQNLLIKPELI